MTPVRRDAWWLLADPTLLLMALLAVLLVPWFLIGPGGMRSSWILQTGLDVLLALFAWRLARISGPGRRSSGLTATEQRITDLATAGRSNKQIAAELHITVRTVESNLTRVYRKHGVSSRAQLAHLVRQEVESGRR